MPKAMKQNPALAYPEVLDPELREGRLHKNLYCESTFVPLLRLLLQPLLPA